MVLGCGNKFIKYLLFTVNFIICICGAVITGVSLWATLDKHFTENLREFIKHTTISIDVNELSKYQGSLWVLAGVGLLLCVFGFIGCCGTACESTTLLGLYFIIILLLAIVEVTAVAFTIINKGKFHDTLEKILNVPILDLQSNITRAQLKPIQDLFHCCGTTAKDQKLFIDGGNCPDEQQYELDCFTSIWNWINKSRWAAMSIVFVVLVAEIVAVIATFILRAGIRAGDRGYTEL